MVECRKKKILIILGTVFAGIVSSIGVGGILFRYEMKSNDCRWTLEWRIFISISDELSLLKYKSENREKIIR